MKINADLYVKDIPGQLVGSLEPISAMNGNIVGVVHNREQVISGRIAVNVTFDIDLDKVETLKKEWKSRDVIVARMGTAFEVFSMDYMLIGNVKASAIEEMINEVSESIDFESVDVEYSSKISSSTRTAMISAKVHSQQDLDTLDKFLSNSSKKAGFVYVRGLGQ
jgi:ACT domain-containing protein